MLLKEYFYLILLEIKNKACHEISILFPYESLNMLYTEKNSFVVCEYM